MLQPWSLFCCVSSVYLSCLMPCQLSSCSSLLLNISVPHTTALLRPAPDTHCIADLEAVLITVGTFFLLLPHHSDHWNVYPLAYPHVPRLSPLVFYGHVEIIQVFDSVPFISQFKALLISSARLTSRRLFPQLLRQSLSFKKGLLSINTSQWSNIASPLAICWSSSKHLYFWPSFYFL